MAYWFLMSRSELAAVQWTELEETLKRAREHMIGRYNEEVTPEQQREFNQFMGTLKPETRDFVQHYMSEFRRRGGDMPEAVQQGGFREVSAASRHRGGNKEYGKL